MRKELQDELDRMRQWVKTHSTVSAAHMSRRIELERMEAAEQAHAQVLHVFRGGTSNA